jgi:signal transduction histidine kinase
MDDKEIDTDALATSLDEALEQLDRIREDDIRLLSHRLHPSIVRVSALAGLRSLQEFYEPTIPISLDVGEEVQALEPAGASEIPESIRLAVHRVADAALANVVKHAGATEAVIHWHFNSENQYLELSITDDGRGFEPDARAPSGLGLLTIRDYVDAIGGNLSVTSFPGKGTGVEVVIPFSGAVQDGIPESDDPGAIGSVLNMHWTPPPGRPASVPEKGEDESGLPRAIGQ